MSYLCAFLYLAGVINMSMLLVMSKDLKELERSGFTRRDIRMMDTGFALLWPFVAIAFAMKVASK